MNLNQELQSRATRGTEIGANAMLARLDTGLAGTNRRVAFAQPGLGFLAAAVVTLVLVGGTLWVLRPSSEPPPVVDTITTTSTSTTTTTSLPEETTATTTEIVDAAVANRYFVFEFDPRTDDLDDLRTALETYDASPYALIRLVEEGGAATQRVVFEYLEQPSAWNVQTLVAMEEYGSPAGTYESRIPWPDSVRTQIRNSLELAAFSTFGDDAELLVALQKSQLEDILRSCLETDSCAFGSAWYAIPEVVSRISGEQSGLMFEGTMLITSDTGEASEYPFTASSADGWTFDFPEYTPLVTIAQPSVMFVVTTDVDLWGYADPSAELVLERRYHAPEGSISTERAVAVDPVSGYWAADAWDAPPEPGVYDMRFHATLPDGSAETTSMFIFYVPDATRQFAFIRGIDTTGTRPALIVDYAEFLGGEEAVQAAIEDGELPADQADEGLPNDFYIRNQNPRLRTLPFEPNAPIYLFDYTIGEEFDFDAVTLDELVQIMEDGEGGAYYGGVTDSPVWLVVQDGVILQLEPQYLP